MSSWWVVSVGALGAVLGAGSALSLRRAGYRLPDDEPRLPLTTPVDGVRPVWGGPTLLMTGVVMAGLGGVYATLAARAGALQLLPAALVFALAGVWVAWIDLDVLRIPNQVLAKAAPAVAVTGWLGAAAMGEWARIGTSLAAAAVLVVFYYLLAAGRRHTSDLAFGPAIVLGTLVAVAMAPS